MYESIGATPTVKSGDVLAHRVTPSLAVDCCGGVFNRLSIATELNLPPADVGMQFSGLQRQGFMSTSATNWSVAGSSIQCGVKGTVTNSMSCTAAPARQRASLPCALSRDGNREICITAIASAGRQKDRIIRSPVCNISHGSSGDLSPHKSLRTCRPKLPD